MLKDLSGCVLDKSWEYIWLCETSRGQTAVLKMISLKDRVMALRVREINGKIKSKDVHV